MSALVTLALLFVIPAVSVTVGAHIVDAHRIKRWDRRRNAPPEPPKPKFALSGEKDSDGLAKLVRVPPTGGSALPKGLAALPQFYYSTKPAPSPEHAARPDHIYGVKSMDEVLDAFYLHHSHLKDAGTPEKKKPDFHKVIAEYGKPHRPIRKPSSATTARGRERAQKIIKEARDRNTKWSPGPK